MEPAEFRVCRRNQSLVALAIDLAPAPVMAWVAFKCFADDRTRGLLQLASILAVSAFVALWLPIRMAPRIGRLCDLGRREELALTFLDPAGYLAPRVWPPLAAILTPALLADASYAKSFFDCWDLQDKTSLVLLLVIQVGTLAMALSALNLASHAIRQCEGGRPPGDAAVSLLFRGMLALALPYGGAFGLLYCLAELEMEMIPAFVIANTAAGASLVAVLLKLPRRWRSLCAAYFRFN